MTIARDQWQLFGIDLTRLPVAWLQGWREVATWPWIAPLVPRVPVEVHDAAGGVSVRNGATATVLTGAKPSVVALELPDEGVLLNHVRLPVLPAAEMRSALELEVAAVSPFAPEESLWGWHVQPAGSGAVGVKDVTLAIASRAYVRRQLNAVSASLPPGRPVEVWARSGDAVVVLQGFDEKVRRGLERRRLAGLVGQVVMAVLLLLALAATPVLQAHQQAIDAEDRFATLRAAVADDLQLRDSLVQRKHQVEALRAHFGAPTDLLELLDRLTQLVPDDAYLTAFNWSDDGSASIKGLASNAAALIDTVGSEPGLTLVRSPTAIARDRRTKLETFTIAFALETVEAQ